MKRITKLNYAALLCSLAMILFFHSKADCQVIENGDFEEWVFDDSTFIQLTGWGYISGTSADETTPDPIERIENAVSGNYALQLASTLSSIEGPTDSEIFQYPELEVPVQSVTLNFQYAVDAISDVEGYAQVIFQGRDYITGEIIAEETLQISEVVDQYTTGTLLLDAGESAIDDLVIKLKAQNYNTGASSSGLTIARFDDFNLSTVVSSNFTDKPAIELSLQPNPVSDQVSLKTEMRIEQLALMDSNGKLVKQLSPTQRKVDMAALPSGIYILRISTQQGMVSRKVVKE